MPLKFSTMTYTFARQVDHFDLDRMLKFTHEVMDGIDFVTLHDRDPRELRLRVDDLAIPVACHTFFAKGLPSENPEERRNGIDDCKRGIEAAVILGAPVVMIPTPGNPDMDRDLLRRRWIEGLKAVAPIAEDAGVALTIENFPGVNSPVVLAADFLEAQTEVPSLRLTYDNGNAASGEDPVASFRQCAPQVVHAHFKDWTVSREPREGFRPMLDGAYYCPALIGEGDIDPVPCLRAMIEAGYAGFVNIEYENNAYDPYEATRRAVGTLRAAMEGLST